MRSASERADGEAMVPEFLEHRAGEAKSALSYAARSLPSTIQQ